LQGQRKELILEQILEKRTVEVQDTPVEQVLVGWQEEGMDAATWEDVRMMKEQFPDFHLYSG